METSKVAVMMSTYNGELYIKEQIESIINQEDVKVKLFIRDDGSSDSTLEIINKYKHSIDLEIIQGKNVGAGKSFMLLMKHVLNSMEDFDYYSFADQDDIWLKDKLKRATQLLNNDEAMMYCSNIYFFIDSNSFSLFKDDSFIPPTLKKSVIKCWLTGNTYVFNKKMAVLFKQTKFPCDELLRYRFHDTWLYSLALAYGKVIYDKKASMYYRIHNSNVSMKKVSYFEKFLLSFSKNKHRKGMRSLQAKQLLEKSLFLKEEDKKMLHELADYRKSIKSRIRLINDQEIRDISKENKIIFSIKVFLGFF